MSKLGDALGGKDAVLKGAPRRAYMDSGIQFEEITGTYSIWDLLEYILESISGGGIVDGDGIYDGNGTVPNPTVATLAGTFTFQTDTSDSPENAARFQIAKATTFPVRLEQYKTADANVWAGIRANVDGATILRGGLTGITLITAGVAAGSAKDNGVLLLSSGGVLDTPAYTMPSDTPDGLGEGVGNYVWTVDQDGDNAAWVDVSTLGGGGGASVAYDSPTSGAVTAQVTRIGGTATTLTNPAAGEYNLNIQSGADFQMASIFGNNTTLNGSNEMIIRVNNAANSRDRRVLVQLYDAQNGALVDQQTTATVHTQAISGNVTTITIPGLNGFGATGFFVEIR